MSTNQLTQYCRYWCFHCQREGSSQATHDVRNNEPAGKTRAPYVISNNFCDYFSSLGSSFIQRKAIVKAMAVSFQRPVRKEVKIRQETEGKRREISLNRPMFEYSHLEMLICYLIY